MGLYLLGQMVEVIARISSNPLTHYIPHFAAIMHQALHSFKQASSIRLPCSQDLIQETIEISLMDQCPTTHHPKAQPNPAVPSIPLPNFEIFVNLTDPHPPVVSYNAHQTLPDVPDLVVVV